MFLLSEALQNICTIAAPVVMAVVAFIIALGKVLSNLKAILDKSNLDNICDNIKAEKESLGAQLDEIVELYKKVMIENAELKKHQSELYTEIKRIQKGD